ncbi:hypothetical protein JOB18_019991 [Solea senegalensis]|uniref:Uncharacterized protein n=1 Tax=Solea senegalensis TaxID=28829 RepID=A0AAV6QI51_SOLSE|nr:hypothetical protein JOB18_019991 [Solea senegalensis]
MTSSEGPAGPDETLKLSRVLSGAFCWALSRDIREKSEACSVQEVVELQPRLRPPESVSRPRYTAPTHTCAAAAASSKSHKIPLTSHLRDPQGELHRTVPRAASLINNAVVISEGPIVIGDARFERRANISKWNTRRKHPGLYYLSCCFRWQGRHNSPLFLPHAHTHAHTPASQVSVIGLALRERSKKAIIASVRNGALKRLVMDFQILVQDGHFSKRGPLTVYTAKHQFTAPALRSQRDGNHGDEAMPLTMNTMADEEDILLSCDTPPPLPRLSPASPPEPPALLMPTICVFAQFASTTATQRFPCSFVCVCLCVWCLNLPAKYLPYTSSSSSLFERGVIQVNTNMEKPPTFTVNVINNCFYSHCPLKKFTCRHDPHICYRGLLIGTRSLGVEKASRPASHDESSTVTGGWGGLGVFFGSGITRGTHKSTPFTALPLPVSSKPQRSEVKSVMTGYTPTVVSQSSSSRNIQRDELPFDKSMFSRD